MIKVCERCGNSFEVTAPNKRFCSRSCNGKTVKRTCETCGGTFWARPYKVKQGKARFCSQDCANSGWFEPCANCGKQIKRTPHHGKRFDNAFCSRECYGEWKSERIVVKCKQCGVETLKKPSEIEAANNNFCSVSCYNDFRAAEFTTFICKYCGNSFQVQSSFVNDNMYRAIYCSNECAANGRKLPDSVRSEYDHQFTEALKEEIRQRDNYTCQLCGLHQSDNYRSLDVHHIDYNKTNCHPSNLISLCGSCHPKTNYNRDYWLSLFTKRLQRREVA